VEQLDTILDYHQVRGAVKCKLFVLTLKGATMTWFTGIHDNSIDSWGELCSEFTSHFTARRKGSRTMSALNDVVLDKKETLREYVERFTQEGVKVQCAHAGLKCFIFESNLRDDCKLKEELGLQAATDMNDLLTRVQPYINYKENKLAEEALRKKLSNKVGDDRHRGNNKQTRGSRLRFKNYNPLNMSQETILQECFNTEFKEDDIKSPQLLKESTRTDKTKYCHYHWSRGHDTKECYQLQEAIEEFIKKGKLI